MGRGCKRARAEKRGLWVLAVRLLSLVLLVLSVFVVVMQTLDRVETNMVKTSSG